MSSSSSSSSAAVMCFGFSPIGCPISEKLSKHNFPLWSLQVLSTLRSCQPEHYIDPDTEVPPRKIAKDSTKPTELSDNPEYKEWVAKDQQIVNYLLSSITKVVMVQVSNCTTSAEMWRVIQEMTASQSRGRIINMRMALATAQKGSSTIAEYFSKMKSLADDMASEGKRLEDEEIASFILAGLDAEYNPIVSSVTSRGKEPLSLGQLHTQLVSWEQRIDLQERRRIWLLRQHRYTWRSWRFQAWRSRTWSWSWPQWWPWWPQGPQRRGLPTLWQRWPHRLALLQTLRCFLHGSQGTTLGFISNQLLWSRYKLVHRHWRYRSHHGGAREAHRERQVPWLQPSPHCFR